MKPKTEEWVAKAEGDFVTASREMRARKSPNFDAVCFHVQQCAEKYIKARLMEAGKQPPRIHNLIALLNLALKYEPMWESFRDILATLTVFAVDLRYPDNSADRAMALEAMRKLKPFRLAARQALGMKME